MDKTQNEELRPDKQEQQRIVGNKYYLKERLGSGSFGTIYKGYTIDSNAPVAVKVEKYTPDNSTLYHEARVLSELIDGFGFPHLLFFTREDQFSYMVMTYLGQNLEKLLKYCGMKFSLKTVLMLADQMFTRIEYLHEKGILHRDIKPENFVMGTGKQSRNLHLIDFGLAKYWRDQSGRHNAWKEGKGLVGTARYASINAHKGFEQGRRDDLESIGYILLYFLKGKLPWQNMKCTDKEDKYAKIAEVKAATSISDLCKDTPSFFSTYMNYVKNLGFSAAPDYKYLKKILRTCFLDNRFDFDYHYDWVKTSEPSSSPKPSQQLTKDYGNFKKFDEILNNRKKNTEAATPAKEKKEEIELNCGTPAHNPIPLPAPAKKHHTKIASPQIKVIDVKENEKLPLMALAEPDQEPGKNLASATKLADASLGLVTPKNSQYGASRIKDESMHSSKVIFRSKGGPEEEEKKKVDGSLGLKYYQAQILDEFLITTPVRGERKLTEASGEVKIGSEQVNSDNPRPSKPTTRTCIMLHGSC